MSTDTSADRLSNKWIRAFRVLNASNGVPIAVTVFLCYHLHGLLVWYKSITTPENFDATAFWGAVVGLITGVIGLVKYMYHTGVDLKPPKTDG